MTRTGTDPMDRWRFPDDPWAIVETAPSTDDLGTTETLFSVGNGYLGMRGNPSEGRDSFSHGTYINGFHEIWDIHHAENAYGFARTGQTIVNVPDAKLMKLYVDDEPLLLSVNEIQSYKRWIDFREGVLRRELVWRTPAEAVAGGDVTDGVLHPPSHGSHEHRGDDARGGCPHRHQLSDPQS